MLSAGLTPYELALSTKSSEIGAFLYEECSLYTAINPSNDVSVCYVLIVCLLASSPS